MDNEPKLTPEQAEQIREKVRQFWAEELTQSEAPRPSWVEPLWICEEGTA
jgi:hypothetical protein